MSITRPKPSSWVPITSFDEPATLIWAVPGPPRKPTAIATPSISLISSTRWGLKPHEPSRSVSMKKSAPKEESSIEENVFLKLVPTTRTIATRARPTIKAEAVDAVLRGFLLAFSLAKCPDARANRVRGQPKSRAAGLAMRVLRREIDINNSNAPAAKSPSCRRAPPSVVVPKAVARTPPVPKRSPTMVRRRPPPDQRVRSSRKAAMGGILEALRAGEIAASRVIPIPTIAAAIHVRAAMTNGPSGKPDPSPA